ncbi:MAG: hypothetical protein AB8I08_39000 [Sandaracinaceae bacterium]
MQPKAAPRLDGSRLGCHRGVDLRRDCAPELPRRKRGGPPGDAAVDASPGERYWVRSTNPVATVEQRGDPTKIRVGEAERWLEELSVIAPCPPVDSAQPEPGVHVTALWNGTSLYQGTLVSTEGQQVVVRWHDGSEPSAVPVSDVLEVWPAAPPRSHTP